MGESEEGVLVEEERRAIGTEPDEDAVWEICEVGGWVVVLPMEVEALLVEDFVEFGGA